MARTKVKKERVLTKTEEKRKAHYPETSTFHWYNANQKGKLDGDCVFRAMATVLDTTWEEAVRDMCEMSIKTGYCINGRKNIAKYLESKGFVKQAQPRDYDNSKITIKQFLLENKTWLKGKKLFVNAGSGHVAAIVDGKIWDTWDSTWTKIGNYWIK